MSEPSQVDCQDVQLFYDERLGQGAYGFVCKAKFCELTCAAKILHPSFFESNDPKSSTILARFKQECELLKRMDHPNVVQCLHLSHDPRSGLPVLLMELLDESLTHFLEHSEEPLPYHLQVNLWHDIALALTYLHSKNIIHRDLSGNNVLLIAGSRAKVTDFGMSKLTVVNAYLSQGGLTHCPGTLWYMSPETFMEPPMYSNKLDVFSSGVVAMQIITRELPEPAERLLKRNEPSAPSGFSYIPIPEVKRRKNHIDLIDPDHPMLPMIKKCLADKEEDRPSAREVCHQLASLKEATKYVQSKQQPTPKERKIREQELQIQKLQSEVEDWQYLIRQLPPGMYMLRTDCKLDQFVNGSPVYKPVNRFLNWLARFQLYKAKWSRL